ncbi:MAG: type II secretion system F family protein [Deltaproteobacteria bacterium]|nr:type II secretion system F family protein [Deltaproteobacteria bacterium]
MKSARAYFARVECVRRLRAMTTATAHATPLPRGAFDTLYRKRHVLAAVTFTVILALAPLDVRVLLRGGVALSSLMLILLLTRRFALHRRHRAATATFLEDLPAVLLATAASMRVGLAAYPALSRSAHALPSHSPVREEIEQLLSHLSSGVRPERALALFGARFSSPDLPLFRSALALVAEHGGPLAPTLHRLAVITRDRMTLIRQARSITALTRMTSSIIVMLCPVLLCSLSFRSDDFWATAVTEPVARACTISGLVVIAIGHATVLRMSAFRP